jgi:hypothetical protein
MIFSTDRTVARIKSAKKHNPFHWLGRITRQQRGKFYVKPRMICGRETAKGWQFQ